MNQTEIEHTLKILSDDIQRKSPYTRTYYLSIARKFLEESGDFSRHGIMTFMNDCGYCDNSLRTTHYIIQKLCKAIDKPFPLDKEDLPPIPDENDINTPTMSVDNVAKLIQYWREYPGSYPTSLLYLSTVYGLRSLEMTTIEFGDHSVIVNVAKRKAKVVREHPVPGDGLIYLCGYEHLSETSVRYTFRKVCRKAGVKRMKGENWHSIRRALVTTCRANNVNPVLIKQFMRWARDRRDMADMYFHMPFDKVNEEIFKVHPFVNLWG